MKLTFNAATFENGKLCLEVSNRQMARRFVMEMKQRAYQAEIKEYREKRSLDANAYCWVLIGELAEVTGIKAEEIYRQAIKDIGGNYDVITVRDNAVDKFCTMWSAGHIGQITAILGANPMLGYTDVIAYYGSSTYDAKQMARLIDTIVQECKEQGIETMPQEKLKSIVGAWNA